MGNAITGTIVGFVSHDSVTHHNFYKILQDLRIKYGLEEMHECNMMKYGPPIVGKEQYGAELSGWSLLWYTPQGAINHVKAFLYDCEKELKKAGATGITTDI
jgi:hypothetical protein